MLKNILNMMNETKVFQCNNKDIIDINESNMSGYTEDVPQLEKYFTLSAKNSRRYHELGKIMHNRDNIMLSEELIKEIALDKLFKNYMINEIEQLILKYY